MSWPQPGDYDDALQNPNIHFQHPELKIGKPFKDSGRILTWPGKSGIVFQMDCSGRYWAVKCFTRASIDEEERYKAISDFIKQCQLPYFVQCQLIPDAILIKGNKFPVLRMEWVEGDVNLVQYLQSNYHNSPLIAALAQQWLTMTRDLRLQGVAHGDLQFGNVLMVGNTIKLVDYDGMYVPALSGRQADELGHPNFQHPDRSTSDYGPYLDHFSAWSIYTSLYCISCDPQLFKKTGEGLNDALLFEARDYESPDNSRIFNDLRNHSNPQVRELGSIFYGLVKLGTRGIPSLDDNVPTSPTANYYKILGVPGNTTSVQIKQAHTVMSMIWAPGYYQQNSELKEMALGKLEQLNEAYDKLEKLVKLTSASASAQGNTVGDWLWDADTTASRSAPLESWFVDEGNVASPSNKYAHNDVTRGISKDWLVECKKLCSDFSAPAKVLPKNSHSPLSRVLTDGWLTPLKVLTTVVVLALGIGGYAAEPMLKKTAISKIEEAMIKLDGGGYLMGSSAIANAAPVHPEIVKPFLLSRFETTQFQFETLAGRNPSHFKGFADRPVENITWDDCQRFIDSLNKSQGKYKYRLPTETEWEFACRAKSITDYCFGNSDKELEKFAWIWPNSAGETHAGGVLLPNKWGLYDMYGNVGEWCQNNYIRYSNESDDEHETKSDDRKIVRGGSWLSYSRGDKSDRPSRSSYRFAVEKQFGSDTIGMRLAADPVKPADQFDDSQARSSIAAEYVKRGMLKEAESAYKGLLPLKPASSDYRDPTTRQNVLGLAELYLKQSKKSEAETLLTNVLQASEQGNEPVDCLRGLVDIGTLYRDMGEHLKAERLFKQVIQTAKMKGTSANSIFVEASLCLSDMLKENRLSEAEAVVRDAAARLTTDDGQILAKEIEERQIEFKKTRLRLSWKAHVAAGNAAFKDANYQSAENNLTSALNEARGLEDQENLAASLNNLAAVLHAQQKFESAEPLYAEAMEILRSQNSANSKKTLRQLLKNYARLRRSTDRPDSAKELEEEAATL